MAEIQKQMSTSKLRSFLKKDSAIFMLGSSYLPLEVQLEVFFTTSLSRFLANLAALVSSSEAFLVVAPGRRRRGRACQSFNTNRKAQCTGPCARGRVELARRVARSNDSSCLVRSSAPRLGPTRRSPLTSHRGTRWSRAACC